MSVDPLSIAIYLSVLLLVWVPYGLRRRSLTARSRAVLAESRQAELMEPASLHPLIDESRCLGCAACIPACPEQNVLGLIGGKAVLTTPANCIGHGACKEACPFDAITLVLGTEKRGVDIPVLAADFETNVPGIFVAGELGGMGLIRNAIEQGCQAIDSVRAMRGIGQGDDLDVVIVGAGPAGFAASLSATQHGLRFVTLEQETLGGAVAHYPRGKIVMTAPVHLPLYGRVKLRETTKESLLGLWRDVEKTARLALHYEERVESIGRNGRGFEVKSSRGVYRAKAVLLAIGRRGTPRKLGVPGEEHEKVVYRLLDPHQYRDRSVLVVGGGDSALEAAVGIAEQPGARVTLSYRGTGFSRAKPKNRQRIDEAAADDRVQVLLESTVVDVAPSLVRVARRDDVVALENDAVLVCAGGILPTDFLRSVGVEIETKRGTV